MMPTIHGADAVVMNTVAMMEIAKALSIPIILTEQYTKGLGKSVPTISNALPPDAHAFEKSRFSPLTADVDRTLSALGRSDVLICGIEAHVCVLQTTLDLLATGRQVYLVSDAISSSEPEQGNHAIRRMERNGAVTSGVLSASYELMQDANHPAFKAVLTAVKSRLPSAH